MSRRGILIVLVSVLLAGFVLPACASAGNWLGLLKWQRRVPAESVGNPKRIVAPPPGPHRYPEYNTGPCPWYGYGFGVPTYNWGYFGARYRPATIAHSGYYDTYTQWGYRRGY